MEVENIGQPRIIEKRLFLWFMKDYDVILTRGASYEFRSVKYEENP